VAACAGRGASGPDVSHVADVLGYHIYAASAPAIAAPARTCDGGVSMMGDQEVGLRVENGEYGVLTGAL